MPSENFAAKKEKGDDRTNLRGVVISTLWRNLPLRQEKVSPQGRNDIPAKSVIGTLWTPILGIPCRKGRCLHKVGMTP